MMNEERVLTETRVKLLYLRNSKHSEHFEGIANSYVRKCNFIIIFKQAKQATYSVGCKMETIMVLHMSLNQSERMPIIIAT